MNQIPYVAHAGHVHSETEAAAMAPIPPFTVAGAVIVLVAVIIGIVVLSRTSRNQRKSPVTVKSVDK